MVKNEINKEDEEIIRENYIKSYEKWLSELGQKRERHPQDAVPFEEWLVNKLNEISLQQKVNVSLGKAKTLPVTFGDIFTELDFEKYLEPMCTMEKPLLRKNNDNSYTLLRGKSAICRYFYHDLKNTALKAKIRQEDISNVLYESIKDFGTMPNRNSYNYTFIYADLKKHIANKN